MALCSRVTSPRRVSARRYFFRFGIAIAVASPALLAALGNETMFRATEGSGGNSFIKSPRWPVFAVLGPRVA